MKLDYIPILNSDIESKLISIFCMDLYGCSLWNIGSNYVAAFYIAWRKTIRAIWKLPFRTHFNLIHGINDTLPINVKQIK